MGLFEPEKNGKTHGSEQPYEQPVAPALKLAFELGQICITPGAAEVISPELVLRSLRRHASGDWGELSEEDAKENERSLRDGSRLLSAYKTEYGEKFWIITEADRSVTTILLPSEY